MDSRNLHESFTEVPLYEYLRDVLVSKRVNADTY